MCILYMNLCMCICMYASMYVYTLLKVSIYVYMYACTVGPFINMYCWTVHSGTLNPSSLLVPAIEMGAGISNSECDL